MYVIGLDIQIIIQVQSVFQFGDNFLISFDFNRYNLKVLTLLQQQFRLCFVFYFNVYVYLHKNVPVIM